MLAHRSSIVRAALAAALALAAGCGGSSGSGPMKPPPDVSAQLAALSTRRVFFGHQSVGWNIVGGLQGLLDANGGAEPTITHTATPAAVTAGTFAHYEIAANEHPDQKIANFGALLSGELGAAVDVAFLKFCFVDFQVQSDAQLDALFAAYQQMVHDVRAAHPGLKLVHLTVPLSPQDDPNNARRERFSDRLRAAYGGDVFDLARLESADPTTGAPIRGANGPMLYSGWKEDDSGHLNPTGSQAVARALVAFLAGS
jgi:hypothetical protein